VRRALIAVVAAGLLAAACSSSSKDSGSTSSSTTTTPTTKAIPAPKGLPEFYAVPGSLPVKAGTLVKSQKVAVKGLHGTAYRVMYVSEGVDGRPVAVTGTIMVPSKAAPADGYPVVSWAHGTNGMADVCAPSLDPGNSVPLANQLLDKGWLVTATDYQGEGTPGLHPYIAGINSSNDTVDIVRAARELADAHASDQYVVWGHSQGGHTAMFALDRGAKYAPDLKLRGVVAGAPPSQFAFIYNYLLTSPFRYYLLMAAGGLNAAYGDARAPLDQVLTPAGIKQLPVLDQGCAGFVDQKIGGLDVSKLSKGDPFKVPAWKKILQENDPQYFTTASAAPLLIIQGGNDEQIPVVSTQVLAQHLCGIHQVLQRWIYPGQSHSGVIAPSAGDMIHWISDRFAGDSNPDPYKPTGQTDVQTTTCGGSS
jgi:dipeptidyl aminopeptidase/acylaminoacyl peptidase